MAGLPVAAAFDVGGTRIKAALVDAELGVHAQLTAPTPSSFAADPGGALANLMPALLADADTGVTLERAAVVVPGLVDDEAGIAMLSVNLGWRDLPMADVVGVALGVPTRLSHDVRAGLLAERQLGAARGVDHALFLPLGTGIAAALMVDGRVLRAEGMAGELGHAVVDPQGAACPCGGVGCLETIASASAIARRYTERTGRRATAQEIAELVRTGTDEDAGRVWAEAIEALASVLGTVLMATGIDLVIIGGGLVLSGETLLAPLREALAARTTLGHRPDVVASTLLDRAGCLGAAVRAWETP